MLYFVRRVMIPCSISSRFETIQWYLGQPKPRPPGADPSSKSQEALLGASLTSTAPQNQFNDIVIEFLATT